MKSLVAAVAVLVALAVGAQAQTPEVDALRARAEQGDVEAQWGLGSLYEQGTNDLAQDYTEAVRWWRLAADQGNARAQVNLGTMYGAGLGVPENPVEAARWNRRAADQGNANGQFNVGISYLTGDGVPEDYVAAHMWLNLAAAQFTGEQRETAVEYRGMVANVMTPAQLAEAQRLAREWDAAHPRAP